MQRAAFLRPAAPSTGQLYIIYFFVVRTDRAVGNMYSRQYYRIADCVGRTASVERFLSSLAFHFCSAGHDSLLRRPVPVYSGIPSAAETGVTIGMFLLRLLYHLVELF